MSADERDQFLAMVTQGPLVRGDAIIVCCGEDADVRLNMALGLFQPPHSAAPIILLSGGVHSLPRWKGAERCAATLYGKGIRPSAILTETESLHTRASAVASVRLACDRGWKRILLVASAYHAYRAYLTFLHALTDVGHHRTLQLVLVPATAPWFAAPPGMTAMRAELLAGELVKIEEYRVAGHVASYADALATLRYWEHGPATELAA